MTQKTLDDTIVQLEHAMQNCSNHEKADAAQRLRALLTPKTTTRTDVADSADVEEDLFDNMPI